jgi:hypothetical protein
MSSPSSTSASCRASGSVPARSTSTLRTPAIRATMRNGSAWSRRRVTTKRAGVQHLDEDEDEKDAVEDQRRPRRGAGTPPECGDGVRQDDDRGGHEEGPAGDVDQDLDRLARPLRRRDGLEGHLAHRRSRGSSPPRHGAWAAYREREVKLEVPPDFQLPDLGERPTDRFREVELELVDSPNGVLDASSPGCDARAREGLIPPPS